MVTPRLKSLVLQTGVFLLAMFRPMVRARLAQVRLILCLRLAVVEVLVRNNVIIVLIPFECPSLLVMWPSVLMVCLSRLVLLATRGAVIELSVLASVFMKLTCPLPIA